MAFVFPAVAALIGGTVAAGAMAATVFAAVTEIGIASTVVGAITGNKNLMKVGAVLGAVGGLGGLAAGALGGAAEGAVLGAGEDVLSAGAVNGADAMSDAFVASGAEGAGGFQSAISDVVNNGASAYNEILPETSSPTADTTLTGDSAADKIVAPAAEVKPETPETITTQSNTGQSAPDTSMTVQNNSTNALDGQTDLGKVDPITGQEQASTPTSGDLSRSDRLAALSAPQTADSYFKNFMDFIKQNKEVSNGIMQLGGGLLKGMGESSLADKKMAIEQQKVNQSSYGNQVATYKPQGFIQTARA